MGRRAIYGPALSCSYLRLWFPLPVSNIIQFSLFPLAVSPLFIYIPWSVVSPPRHSAALWDGQPCANTNLFTTFTDRRPGAARLTRHSESCRGRTGADLSQRTCRAGSGLESTWDGLGKVQSSVGSRSSGCKGILPSSLTKGAHLLSVECRYHILCSHHL